MNEKIKITIEMPVEKAEVIETNQALVLAVREDSGDIMSYHRILAGAKHVDCVYIGLSAIEAVLETLDTATPEMREAFIRGAEKILHEAKGSAKV